jgi:hypothetical protein
MIDDGEIALIAAFRLHEVGSRLDVLARVARSAELRQTLAGLAEQIAIHEQQVADVAATLPDHTRASEGRTRHES